MRAPALLAIAALAACATPRADRIPLSSPEAFGPSGYAAPDSPRPAPPLPVALASFSERGRTFRRRAARGAAMPAGQAENWRGLLDALSALWRRPPSQISQEELSTVRALLESELELDAQTYGEFPPEVAESALRAVGRLALRASQLRRLAEAGPSTGAGRAGPLTFAWPISPVEITSTFGKRHHPVTRRYQDHAGVDLAARRGQLVTAAAPGTVRFAGWNGAYGRQVELEHPGGVVTRYGHLSQLLVEAGAQVDQGDPIGLAGSSGRSTGVHLHFELIREGSPCDPLDELEPPAAEVASR